MKTESLRRHPLLCEHQCGSLEIGFMVILIFRYLLKLEDWWYWKVSNDWGESVNCGPTLAHPLVTTDYSRQLNFMAIFTQNLTKLDKRAYLMFFFHNRFRPSKRFSPDCHLVIFSILTAWHFQSFCNQSWLSPLAKRYNAGFRNYYVVLLSHLLMQSSPWFHAWYNESCYTGVLKRMRAYSALFICFLNFLVQVMKKMISTRQSTFFFICLTFRSSFWEDSFTSLFHPPFIVPLFW